MTATASIALHVCPQEFIKISSVEKCDDGSGYASRLAVGPWPFSCGDHR